MLTTGRRGKGRWSREREDKDLLVVRHAVPGAALSTAHVLAGVREGDARLLGSAASAP